MFQSVVKVFHHHIIRAFLRGKDVRRAGFAAQRVVDVAHTGKVELLGVFHVDFFNVFKRAARRDKGFAAFIEKFHAKGSRNPRAAVVG